MTPYVTDPHPPALSEGQRVHLHPCFFKGSEVESLTAPGWAASNVNQFRRIEYRQILFRKILFIVFHDPDVPPVYGRFHEIDFVREIRALIQKAGKRITNNDVI